MLDAGLLIVLVIVAPLLLRFALDWCARKRRWRIGRWSKLLPGWGEEACRRCETSYRYVAAHGTPVFLAEGRGYVVAVCEGCWQELGTPAARLPFYEQVFREWDAAGTRKRVDDLFAIRAAVAAGV